MIVYDLVCQTGGHRFEGWFASSDDYADQIARGLLTCPTCACATIERAISAPNVGRKGNQITPVRPTPFPAAAPVPAAAPPPPLPPEAMAALKTIALIQAEALKQSTWVGDRFADRARAMHYGETDPAPIHGQATPEQASELIEEGVAIAPILFPVAPPDQAN
jgi:hypothetical protein